jgi:excinuclease ABC subunit A
LGSAREIDPGLVVPDESVSIDMGALLPYSGLSFGFLEQAIDSIAEKFAVDRSKPWRELPEEQRNLFLYGTGSERIHLSYRNYEGRMRHYTAAFHGIVANLQRRYLETESDWVRQKIEEYMAERPCPECNGARLKPTSLAVTVGGINIHELTLSSVRQALEFFGRLELSETERLIGGRVIKEIVERLSFLNDVGVGYLNLQRASATLSGGEAQRIRLATQIGSALVGVLYILDEPSIGLHQRDNRRLIDTLLRLRDLGNTVIVVDALGRSHRRHGSRRRRARRQRGRRGPAGGDHGRGRVGDRRLPRRPAPHHHTRPAASAGRVVHVAGGAHA